MAKDNTCFGLYGGDSHPVCKRCSMTRRCKAILLTNGLEVLGDWADQLVMELPSDGDYADTDSVWDMVNTLKDPTTVPVRDGMMPTIPA